MRTGDCGHLQARARPFAHALLARGPLHFQLGGQRRLERCAVRRQPLVLHPPPRPPAAPASLQARLSASAILSSVSLLWSAPDNPDMALGFMTPNEKQSHHA